MKQNAETVGGQNLLTRVLTDIQFWVPVAVLIAGLLLLKFVH